jgi:LPS sulfotransferase NodH
MKPKLSYTIWFSQRTGSSLLCKALQSTGIAGQPEEWLLRQDLFKEYHVDSHAELQERLWESAGTDNGVLGIKHSFHEPNFSQLLEEFRRFPGCSPTESNRSTIWENAFPNHRHIFMTRRNKVRLAVSWWKAIQSQEWHKQSGETSTSIDLAGAYSFDAIEHLYTEASMREAGIQEFFAEGNIVPLTIVYEDFMQRYEKTIRDILDFLELDHASFSISEPYYSRTADALSEKWAQRFRQDLQSEWPNRGW